MHPYQTGTVMRPFKSHLLQSRFLSGFRSLEISRALLAMKFSGLAFFLEFFSKNKVDTMFACHNNRHDFPDWLKNILLAQNVQ